MIFNIGLAVPLLFTLLSNVQGQQQNITYKVITAPTSNMGVAVVVDGTTFPLQQTLGILYQGEAPIAKTSYHYAIVDANHGINASESFARNPIQADSLNEFFNRSINVYNVSNLPQVLPPLPSIKRIASDLHKDGQIPTIHIWGNETAIAYLNANQQEDVDVELNFTYFG